MVIYLYAVADAIANSN